MLGAAGMSALAADATRPPTEGLGAGPAPGGFVRRFSQKPRNRSSAASVRQPGSSASTCAQNASFFHAPSSTS